MYIFHFYRSCWLEIVVLPLSRLFFFFFLCSSRGIESEPGPACPGPVLVLDRLSCCVCPVCCGLCAGRLHPCHRQGEGGRGRGRGKEEERRGEERRGGEGEGGGGGEGWRGGEREGEERGGEEREREGEGGGGGEGWRGGERAGGGEGWRGEGGGGWGRRRGMERRGEGEGGGGGEGWRGGERGGRRGMERRGGERRGEEGIEVGVRREENRGLRKRDNEIRNMFTDACDIQVELFHLVLNICLGSGIPEMKTILRGITLNNYLTFRTFISKAVSFSTDSVCTDALLTLSFLCVCIYVLYLFVVVVVVVFLSLLHFPV